MRTCIYIRAIADANASSDPFAAASDERRRRIHPFRHPIDGPVSFVAVGILVRILLCVQTKKISFFFSFSFSFLSVLRKSLRPPHPWLTRRRRRCHVHCARCVIILHQSSSCQNRIHAANTIYMCVCLCVFLYYRERGKVKYPRTLFLYVYVGACINRSFVSAAAIHQRETFRINPSSPCIYRYMYYVCSIIVSHCCYTNCMI